jgi:hypothetical protein
VEIVFFTSINKLIAAKTIIPPLNPYVSVDKYFHKKKAIAISLASTGASLSITIFTPVAEVLLDTYGFSKNTISTNNPLDNVGHELHQYPGIRTV